MSISYSLLLGSSDYTQKNHLNQIKDLDAIFLIWTLYFVPNGQREGSKAHQYAWSPLKGTKVPLLDPKESIAFNRSYKEGGVHHESYSMAKLII